MGGGDPFLLPLVLNSKTPGIANITREWDLLGHEEICPYLAPFRQAGEGNSHFLGSMQYILHVLLPCTYDTCISWIPTDLPSLDGEGVLVDLLEADDVGLLEEDGGLVAVGRREGGLAPPLALHHLLAALLEVVRVVQVVHRAPPPPGCRVHGVPESSQIPKCEYQNALLCH